jgi:O-succinylbenzoic acid--CoA ligase
MRVKGSSNSVLLLNPKLPPSEIEALQKIFLNFQGRDEVWLASSGSSRLAEDSLKLIVLDYQGLLTACQSVNQDLQVHSDRRSHWLQILPEFHVGGLSVGLRAHVAQVSLTKIGPFNWSAKDFQSLVSQKKITHTSLVPTQIFDLVEQKLRAPSTLRAVLVGGGPLDWVLCDQAKTLGWPLLPGFGMTETSALCAGASLDSVQQVGPQDFFVLPHIQVRCDERQMLEVQGPSVLKAWAQIQAGKWFYQSVPQGSWWKTQDRVNLSPSQGSTSKIVLRPLGRDSDFVKIKGEGVSIANLRNRLQQMFQDLGRDKLFSVSLQMQVHPRSGAELVLVYEKNVKDAQVLAEKFNQQVLAFERISKLCEVEKIPRNTLGKIDQLALADLILKSAVPLQ